jgi:chromosome segregation ATPase
MDVEAEIRDLKRRVGELEGSFSFLTGQVRDVHRSVLGFQAQTNERFDGVDARFDRLEQKVDGLEGKVEGLAHKVDRLDQNFDELPRALAEVVRTEFDRRDRQS